MTEQFQTNSVITTAVTSPAWALFLDNLNATLTTVLTTLGIVLAIIKIVQAKRGGKEE